MLAMMVLAFCVSLLPSVSDILAAAPCPTSIPNAPSMFIIGNVIAMPDMASGPTPWPMYIRSTML